MSKLPPSASNGAVFLSYASQDAVAVKAICEALRAADVEVWFDQSQLEGGDVWDARIRKQIADCALFVPVISAATQARLEGYFRIEWKLAAQRTHAMAEEKTFLLPVVIDVTGDADARVPSEFRAVQWTKLPAGQTTPTFVNRVRKLLEAQGVELAPRPIAARGTGRAPPAKRPGARAWATGVAVALAIGTAIVISRRSSPASTAPTAPSAAAPGAVLEADDKAVAVLPFANLSGDTAQEYFSDGLTDEIINVLARERDLHVPGRTSSFSFKGRNISAKEIARALNVSRLVEGSVQRVGSHVRISVVLTQVAQGFSEALPSFDRDVTDVFALQDEIARAVLEKITHRTNTSTVAVLTRNSEAYDAYLRGRAHQVQGPVGVKDSIPFFENAVQLDPKFAMAWARLAAAQTTSAISFVVESPQELPAARAALARALDLQPDLPEALIAQAALARAVDHDYATAERVLQHAASLQPATAELRSEQAALARDQGNWPAALQLMRDGLALDPQDGSATQVLAMVAGLRGEFAEADRYWRKAMELQGTSLSNAFLARIYIRQAWRGPAAALRLVERFPPGQPFRETERARLLAWLGRTDEARTLVEKYAMEPPSGNDAIFRMDFVMLWLSVGKTAEARRLAETIRNETQALFDHGNRSMRFRMDLIGSLLVLGERDPAIAQLHAWRDESRELAKRSTWAWMFQYGSRVASLLGQAQMNDEAIEIADQMMAAGFQVGYYLRNNPDYASCQADPRFQALMRKAEAWAAAQPDPTDL